MYSRSPRCENDALTIWDRQDWERLRGLAKSGGFDAPEHPLLVTDEGAVRMARAVRQAATREPTELVGAHMDVREFLEACLSGKIELPQ